MIKKIHQKIYDVSLKYGKKIGLDLPYFVKNGFWTSLAQMIWILKWLVLSIVLTRFFSQEVYGQYQFVMTVLAFVGIFSFPSMTTAIVQAVARWLEWTYRQIVKWVLKWNWLWSIALLIVAGYVWFIGKIPEVAVTLIILSILFPIYGISQYYNSYLSWRSEFKTWVKYRVIFNVISFIAISLVVIFFQNIVLTSLVFVLSSIIINGYLTFWYFFKITDKSISNDSLNFGKKLIWNDVLALSSLHIDKLFVTYFLWFEDLALYAIITLVPDQAKNLIKPLTSLFLPKLSKLDKWKMKRKDLWKFTWYLAIVATFVIILYICFAPFIFKWFYPAYQWWVILSQVYMLSFIFIITTLWIWYYRSIIDHKKLIFFNIVRLSTLVILGPLLMYFYGLTGAIATKMLMRLFLITAVVTKK